MLDRVRRMDSTNSSLDGDELEFSRMDSRESQTSNDERRRNLSGMHVTLLEPQHRFCMGYGLLQDSVVT